jgi:periplasmic divalent cation tolerance protein
MINRSMAFILVYITYPNRKTALKIIEKLLKDKIIACANMFPIKSIYSWKGKVEKNNEIVSIVKTTQSKWNILKKEVCKLHPYDVPAIVKLKAESNKEYERWIINETK